MTSSRQNKRESTVTLNGWEENTKGWKDKQMSNETRIVDLLMGTKREGMGDLIRWMNDNGFFTAPCSGGYHLAEEGGLMAHSLNVLSIMQDMSFLMCDGAMPLDMETRNSIIICALLHDLGKCGDHGKANYVPNMIKDGRPTKAEPEQKYKQSEDKPFKTNPELMYVPHEVRSVAIASRFISLTEDEEWAILMHNGLYGDFRYGIQGKETPLYLLLHFADMWASRVVEIEKQPE